LGKKLRIRYAKKPKIAPAPDRLRADLAGPYDLERFSFELQKLIARAQEHGAGAFGIAPFTLCPPMTGAKRSRYGEKGVPGRIPANAVIRFEVELLEVREAGVLHPDDYQPRKHLLVFRPGEAARNLPRWQFGLREGESAGATITHPLPGSTWRYTRSRSVEIKLDPAQIAELIQSVHSTLADFPEDCLKHDVLWNDTSEKANAIRRDLRTNSLCVSITLSEREVTLCNYSLPETSPVLIGATFYQVITRSLAPYLPEEVNLP
jgi:hypothetical protein